MAADGFQFAFTPEVEAATAPAWEKVKRLVTPIEWRLNAPLIAEINKLMGPTTALRSLSIRPISEPETAVKSDKKEPDLVRQHNRCEGVLQGVAASDVEVGTFFGRLSSCPLLDKVRLSYSHEIELSGRSMREFELKFALRRVALPEKATP